MENKAKGIDVKSLIIGLLIGVCLLLGLAFKEAKENVYVMETHKDGDYAYIFNSKTGHLWLKMLDSTWDFGTPQKPENVMYHAVSENKYVLNGKMVSEEEYEEYKRKKGEKKGDLSLWEREVIQNSEPVE